MLGHKVFQVLSHRFDTYATFQDSNGQWTRLPMYQDRSRTIGGVNALDIDGVVRAIARVKPGVVINCIGIIKQVKEASDPLISLAVNSLFPHRLAELCVATGARMLHVSTDCVFSGRKGKYTEDDVPDAEDLYGRTKLLGEVNRPGCLTIRTSIIGRDFLKQTSLLEWFLSQQGDRVKGYENAIYSGLPTVVLSRIFGDIIADHPTLWGVYQVASERISKYELLMKIRDAMKLDIEIDPCDNPVCDRSLSAAKFATTTGYRIPGWDEMISELVADPTPYDDWREQHATT